MCGTGRGRALLGKAEGYTHTQRRVLGKTRLNTHAEMTEQFLHHQFVYLSYPKHIKI